MNFRPDSPPLSQFHKGLWINFKGLFSRKNLWPLAVGLGATAVSSVWDDNVKDHLAETRRAEEFGQLGHILGNPATIGIASGGFLLASSFTNNARFRSMSFSLAQGFILDFALTHAVKAAAGRERPNGEGKGSFPSGHTSTSFMVATVTSNYYPKIRIPAYVAAGLVGASRLEKNKHYVSDVVAGATLGYIVGKTVVRGSKLLGTGAKITAVPSYSHHDDFRITVLLTF